MPSVQIIDIVTSLWGDSGITHKLIKGFPFAQTHLKEQNKKFKEFLNISGK